MAIFAMALMIWTARQHAGMRAHFEAATATSGKQKNDGRRSRKTVLIGLNKNPQFVITLDPVV
jgi:hypothetical protein